MILENQKCMLPRESQFFRSVHFVGAHNQGRKRKLKGYEGRWGDVCGDFVDHHFNSSREEIQFQESDHMRHPCLPGYSRHVLSISNEQAALLLYVLRTTTSSFSPQDMPETSKLGLCQGWVSGRLHIQTLMVSERQDHHYPQGYASGRIHFRQVSVGVRIQMMTRVCLYPSALHISYLTQPGVHPGRRNPARSVTKRVF